MAITEIKGTITTEDGQVRQFQITDEGYTQWGNTTERCGDTVDAVSAIEDALTDGGFFE